MGDSSGSKQPVAGTLAVFDTTMGKVVVRLFPDKAPKTGDNFIEKSFAIDMRGVSMDFVNEAARVLAKKFKQESVLVVDHSTGRPKLVIRK